MEIIFDMPNSGDPSTVEQKTKWFCKQCHSEDIVFSDGHAVDGTRCWCGGCKSKTTAVFSTVFICKDSRAQTLKLAEGLAKSRMLEVGEYCSEIWIEPAKKRETMGLAYSDKTEIEPVFTSTV